MKDELIDVLAQRHAEKMIYSLSAHGRGEMPGLTLTDVIRINIISAIADAESEKVTPLKLKKSGAHG